MMASFSAVGKPYTLFSFPSTDYPKGEHLELGFIPSQVALGLLPCKGSNVLLPALEANLLYRYDTRYWWIVGGSEAAVRRFSANQTHSGKRLCTR